MMLLGGTRGGEGAEETPFRMGQPLSCLFCYQESQAHPMASLRFLEAWQVLRPSGLHACSASYKCPAHFPSN